jgi:RHS repeat-associated protein
LTLGFTYNPASQIASTTRSNDAYAWTAHGSGTTSTTTNGLNQIASWVGGVSHDAKGNITSSGTYGFTYSSENLLTGLTNSATGAIQASSAYAYDPMMRLAAMDSSNNALDVQFAWDGGEMIYETYGSSRRRRFVFGPGTDEPLVNIYADPNITGRNWFHADERGSSLALSDDNGASGTRGRYDEYGVGNGVSRFHYTGQLWLGDGDLHYYKARVYDAKLGRFLQPDPIGFGGGMNLYAYVNGDPVNLTDPLGLAPGDCAGGSCESFDVSPGDYGTPGIGGSSAGGFIGGGLPARFHFAALIGPCQVDELCATVTAATNCNPQSSQVFSDARIATIMAARATAIRNNQNSSSGRYQEFHAAVRKVPGGYAFMITGAGPEGGGTVPISLNALSSYGSAHNHESDSYRAGEGYLSDRSTNNSGLIQLDSDVRAYSSFFSRSRRYNNGIRGQLHIALAIGRDDGRIYYWAPGSNLNSKGVDVGPTFCQGGQ